jgi:hypothetical protein
VRAALLLLVCLGLAPLPALAGAPAEDWGEETQLLPEWDYRADEHDSLLTKTAGATASASYSFVNDTLSDTWSITKSPLDWGLKGWLGLGAVAGVTTGMIFLSDEPLRRETRDKPSFEKFGDGIRHLGTGPGLIGLTSGFAIAGWILDRPKELHTARLLMEASTSGYIFNAVGKYSFGRNRPKSNHGARSFDPYGGDLSMPSGEATGAFIMAGIITSQYPHWTVQVLSYSLATGVGLGRIALDAHWGSDVFLSAALGIAVSKAVVHFDRKRRARRAVKEALVPNAKPETRHHYVQLSTRAFRWTYVF